MSENIHWTLNVQIVGGPTIAASNTMIVDAYDKIAVAIATGATETIQVQPGGAGQVQFLLINCSNPAHFGDALTYTVNGGGAIKLDALQVLIGDGAVGLLGAPPQTLDVTNSTAQDPVDIEVIVGRKAI